MSVMSSRKSELSLAVAHTSQLVLMTKHEPYEQKSNRDT